MVINTARLRLIAATVATVEAELIGGEALAAQLGARVPEEWPPPLYDEPAMRFTLAMLQASRGEAGWWSYYILRRSGEGAPDEVIGMIGYKGPVTAEGTVEIGYGVVPHYQRQGYATEASLALIERAFSEAAVRAVIAETYPELTPSIGVLEKCGFELIGPGSEEGVIRYRLERAQWECTRRDPTEANA